MLHGDLDRKYDAGRETVRRCTAVTHVSGYLLLLLSGYKSLIVNKPLGSKSWPLPSFSGTLPTTECAARQTSEQRVAALSKRVTK